jgi:outer membrane protein assembly factor BamB
VIVALAALAILAVWLEPDRQRQDRFVRTTMILMLSSFLLWWWLLLLSRLRWKVRLLGCGAAIAAVIAFGMLFEVRGVTGDLLPIFGLRGQPKESQAIGGQASVPGTTTTADAPETTPTPHDFPQFMGPARNCTSPGPDLAREWTASPPTELWRRPVGPAWSGFAIVGQVAVTQEQRGAEETVSAYDLRTGQPLWAHADKAHYSTTIAGEGPRATPTIHDGRVYALGATGRMNCLDLASGKSLWTANVILHHRTKVPDWGLCSSPLIESNLVVIHPGGGTPTLAAYDRLTGEPAWTGGKDSSSYGSPLLATLAGRRQILSFNNSSISAHDPANGDVLWTHPWDGKQPKVALPVLLPGDRVLFSSGYGVGSELLAITRSDDAQWSANRLWKTLKMKAKFTNLIHHDGHLYGLDDGIMACVEVASGQQQWKDGRYGHGQIIQRGGLVIVMCENGEVALIEPAPDALRELGRFTALTDKTWNPPALAGDLLLVRNHKETVCYRLPVTR